MPIECSGNSYSALTNIKAAKKAASFAHTQTVFIQPIASDERMKRVAIAVPVAGLAALLRQLDKEGIRVEHVFSFYSVNLLDYLCVILIGIIASKTRVNN